MKHNKELRLRWPFRILIVFIGVVIVVTAYYPIRSIYKLCMHNYSFNTSINAYKDGNYSYLINKEYNKLTDLYYNSKDYKKENMDQYMKLAYLERDNYLSNVNKLLDKGYSIEDINKIYDKLSDAFIEKLTKEFIFDIIKYIDVDYFKEENYDRYLKYFNGNYQKTVLYVNIGLDKDWYQDPNIIEKFSTTMLVNKFNKLKEGFEVPNIVSISKEFSDGETYLSKEAADAFENMARDAKKEGYDIWANSAYRDYEKQQKLWDYYLKQYGKKYNEKYVARPGFSEHETGLAVDIKSLHNSVFKNSKEYKWVLNNGYKYGFIHRYPSTKIDITGVSTESWHFRYVGVDIATYIYKNNLCYEEYYAMFLDK